MVGLALIWRKNKRPEERGCANAQSWSTFGCSGFTLVTGPKSFKLTLSCEERLRKIGASVVTNSPMTNGR
jgi:hypothetical protein